MTHSIETRLGEIKEHISQQLAMQKEVLTLSQAAIYSGLSKSYLYKLTSKREIPFYRPASKLIFFKRQELDAWLLNNRQTPLADLDIAPTKRIKR